MRAFDFYEFVGILLPGAMLLMAVGYTFNIDLLSSVLIPTSFGGLGAHVLIAYVAGHLLQAVGHSFDSVYWRIWKGMPTDWPITRTESNRYPMAKESVVTLCHTSSSELNLDSWRSLVARVRSTVYACGRAGRLQVFNGIYGMFRGLLATELIIGCFAWASPPSPYIVYPLLAVVFAISLNRFHHFAVQYGGELFANVSELSTNGGD